MNKLIKIGSLSKILKLTDQNNKPLNHIIRYWEKEFKQIRPKKINRQRYYSSDQVEMFKFIKYLLKDKGLTISGVKLLLKSNLNKLDDYNSDSLKALYYKDKIKDKTINVLKKIKGLKKYGKKIPH